MSKPEVEMDPSDLEPNETTCLLSTALSPLNWGIEAPLLLDSLALKIKPEEQVVAMLAINLSTIPLQNLPIKQELI